MEDVLYCPLCGYPLSMVHRYDGETLLIDIGCEDHADDEFTLHIKIPLKQEEIELFEEGDVITKKAVIEVIAVRPEPDYDEDYGEELE